MSEGKPGESVPFPIPRSVGMSSEGVMNPLQPNAFGCGAENIIELSPPPDLFIPETILRAERRTTSVPNFLAGEPRSEAQKLGLRYEEKVKQMLSFAFGKPFHPGPWFVYWDSTARAAKLCQPDGMVEYAQGVILFEIKFRWCAEAWWKMRHLYLPVVEKALEKPVLALCVVTRGLDPSVVVPEPKPRVLTSLEHYKRITGKNENNPVDVFIWKGHER